MTDIILLCSGEDEAQAAPIAARAKALGLNVRLAAQQERDEFDAEAFEAQIDEAGALLVCWSERAAASGAIRTRAAIASAHGKLASCRLTPCSIPFPFDAVPTADLQDWGERPDSAEWRKLVADLGDRLRRPGLVELLRARTANDGEALSAFAKRFPDEPEARRIWSEREAEYREECVSILQDARRRLEQRVANEHSKIENALDAFSRDFDAWLERERRGEASPKPNLATLFALWLERGGRREHSGAPAGADASLEKRATQSDSKALALQQRLETEAGRVRELERRLQEAELQAKRNPRATERGEIVPALPVTAAPASPQRPKKTRRILAGLALVAAAAIGVAASFRSILPLEQAPPEFRAIADRLDATSADLAARGRSWVAEIFAERASEDALGELLAARKDETVARAVAFDPETALQKLKEVAPDRLTPLANFSEREQEEFVLAAAKAAPSELFARLLDARKDEAIDRLVRSERAALLARLNELTTRDAASASGAGAPPARFAEASPTPTAQSSLAHATQPPPRDVVRTPEADVSQQNLADIGKSNVAAPHKIASYRAYDNRDIESDDSAKLRNVDLSSCVSACRKKESCKAYTFDKWNRICYLKSSVGNFKLNPRSSSGVREDIRVPRGPSGGITMERYPARAFPGAGYKKVLSDGSDSCERTCQAEESCVAFTFRLDDGSCRLFKSTGEYFPNELADSGGKRQD